MLNRWVEKELLGTLDELGVGCIGFSPLGPGTADQQVPQRRAPELARQSGRSSLLKDFLSEENLNRVRALNEIAAPPRADTGADGDRLGVARQTRDLGADRSADGKQLDDSLDAIKNLHFTDEELKEIDHYAQEGEIDIWKGAREGTE